jgi:alpha-tubulin suppressor-like RCC1 family protein
MAVGTNTACLLVEGGRVGCFSTTAIGRRIDLAHQGSTWAGPSEPPLVATFVPGLPPAVALGVAVGQEHVCVLRDDHSVACWGNNIRGELGTASTSEGPPPQPVAGLANVASIDMVWATSYAVDREGGAWAWGAGDDGGLGTASTEDQHTPVRVRGLPLVAQIAGGGRHACALTRDGDVLCWGSNEMGELGPTAARASRTATRVADVRHALAIGAGMQRSCALLADGHVVCWGVVGYATPGARQTTYTRPPDMPPYPDSRDPDHFTVTWNPTPTPVPGVEGAVQLTSGDDVDCVRDGRGARCWSAGGHGPGPDVLPPTRLPVSSVTRVAAGAQFACALDAAGKVMCFEIERGRLGPGQVVRFGP